MLRPACRPDVGRIVCRTEPLHVVVGIRRTVPARCLHDFVALSLPLAAAELRLAGAGCEDPPIAVHRRRGGDAIEVIAGFPSALVPAPGAPLVRETLPGGRTAQVLHAGPHDALGSAHERITRWLRGHGVAPPGTVWEEYLLGPAAVDDPRYWITRVVVPLP